MLYQIIERQKKKIEKQDSALLTNLTLPDTLVNTDVRVLATPTPTVLHTKLEALANKHGVHKRQAILAALYIGLQVLDAKGV